MKQVKRRRRGEFWVGGCLLLLACVYIFKSEHFLSSQHRIRVQERIESPPIPTNPKTTFRESFPEAYTGECSTSPKWNTCDHSVCPPRSPLDSVLALDFPVETNWNQSTTDFLQTLLIRSWGANPPSVDLFVRSGCHGKMELHYLFKSLELFWPRFLGEIILVLDFNDKFVDLVPPSTVPLFNFHVVYEHVPCFVSRIFNQYSYLNAYRYSNSEYLVTLDSDCALFRPVTPDVLFTDKRELILVTNQEFQHNIWSDDQRFFTQLNDSEFGHSMVTQPVNFRRDSFPAYFHYVKTLNASSCYEELLDRFSQKPDVNWYCWMCQLSTFVAHKHRTGYALYVSNQKVDQVFLRYAFHVPWDRSLPRRFPYGLAVQESIRQSLCFWFGPSVFEAYCRAVTDFKFHAMLLTTYAHYDLNKHARNSTVLLRRIQDVKQMYKEYYS